MHRICPACTLRKNQLVQPDCIVCQGRGFLLLGAGALSLYTADVVAEAVLLALEAKARESDTTLTLSDDRAAGVREAIAMLTEAGVLASQDAPLHLAPPAEPVYRRTTARKRDAAGRFAPEFDPSEVAAQCVQTELFPLDVTLAHAERFEYEEAERPNARGLPVLSANGHPSHLARVADPMEPGNDTRAEARQRRSEHLHAVALVEAVPEVLRLQERRRRRAKIAV